MKPHLRRLLLLGTLLGVTVLITALVRVPVPLRMTIGGRDAGVYFTLGDTCLFLLALLLGAPWGALLGALGMALSDLIVGSYSYILGSFLIKDGMVLLLCRLLPRCTDLRSCLRAAFLTEGLMVVSYFVYDLVVFGQYSVAAWEIPLNLLQGLVCGAAGAAILRYLPPRARGLLDPSVHRRVR